MTALSYDADVIVAGAGPSGLMVSCEVALGGVNVITLEKRNGPTWARAGTLTPRVLEIFASRGIIDKVLARAFEIHTEPRGFTGIWAGMSELHYDKLDSDYPYIVFLSQIETERLLAERLQMLGGQLRLQHEVIGVDQDADGVTVHVRDAAGADQSLRARYLVGADGNRSAVRTAVGIPFVGTPASRTAINVDARIANPYPNNTKVFYNDAGWAMAYPLRDGVTRFGLIDAATTHEVDDGAPSFDEAMAMLRRVHGSDFGITEVDGITRFHDALFMAERLRERRVFLVGESVRVHYPASGVGMNFCVQDAFNLGWKLAAVAGGRSDEALLDTYETERRPEIESLLDDVRRQCALQFSFDAEHSALKHFIEHDLMPMPSVNLKLCENLSGLSAAYPAPAGSHSLIGRRLPNLDVIHLDGTHDTVFGLLHQQAFVLLDLGDAAIEYDQLPIVTARCHDVGRRALLDGVQGVLIRPDGYVAWVCEDVLSTEAVRKALAAWLKIDAKTDSGSIP